MQPQAVREFDQTALPVFKIEYTRPIEQGCTAPESLELQMTKDFAKWATEPLSGEDAFAAMDPLSILYSDQGSDTLWTQAWNAEISEVAEFYRTNSAKHRRDGTKDQAALAQRKYPSPIEFTVKILEAKDISFDWNEYVNKFEKRHPGATLGKPPLGRLRSGDDKWLLYDYFAIEEEDPAETMKELSIQPGYAAEASLGAASSMQGPPPKATTGDQATGQQAASPTTRSKKTQVEWVPSLYPSQAVKPGEGSSKGKAGNAAPP